MLPRKLERLIPALLLCLLLALAGCRGNSQPTGYRVYTLTEGVGHVTFEYPARFTLASEQVLKDVGYTMVDLESPMSKKDRTRTRLWTTATQSPVGLGPAHSYLEACVATASTLPGYRFIETTALTIDGNPAEEVAYFYYAPRTDFESQMLNLEPVPTITRQVFFTHGDCAWVIGMTSNENTAQADLVDFEHLVATYRVLN